MTAQSDPGALQRKLGLVHVVCIASGAMISSGLFVLPGLAYAKAGPAVMMAYLLAGLLSLPGMLSLAEMATAMPKAGADCYTVIRSMGPGIGTVAGLLSWFALSMKSAFALIGFAVFAATVVSVDVHVVALLCAVAFLVINIVGVKEAASLQLGMAFVLFALMLVYVVMGLPAVEVTRFEPFAPKGLAPAFFVTGYVFISYGGLLKIASVAEEIDRPARNIPMGMMVALGIVVLFYTLMVFVTAGVLEPEALAGSLTPISDGAAAFMGEPGRLLLGLAAVMAFLTTANAGIMTAARSVVPLSRERLFPQVFGRISARFGTPHNALVLTGALVASSIFLKLDILVEAASIVLIMTNVLSCLSVIILRESGVQNYRPSFRAPLYPWLQVAGLVGFGFVLLEMGWEAYLITTLLGLTGFCAYWFYGRKHVRQDSALLHLIERVTARELVTGTLEAELKQVIHERDEVVYDRFDRIIEDCVVLDLEGESMVDDFLLSAGQRLAERVGVDGAVLGKALKEREAESHTALSSELAVPHVVVQGEGKFDILLARSRQGIAFSHDAPNVQAIFVLVGSLDQRNFYLSALAAIAQIARDPEFMVRWMKAKGPQGLRDVVLLGTRVRE